jgi:hypothetical protein
MPSPTSVSGAATLASPSRNAPPCEFCGGPVQIVSRPVRRTYLGRAYLMTRHCLSNCESSMTQAWPREEHTASAMPR